MAHYARHCSSVTLLLCGSALCVLGGLALWQGKSTNDLGNAIAAFARDCNNVKSAGCAWSCSAQPVVSHPYPNALACAWCTGPPSGLPVFCVNNSGALPVPYGDTGVCGTPSRSDGCSDCLYDYGSPTVLVGACAGSSAIAAGLMGIALASCFGTIGLTCCSCICWLSGACFFVGGGTCLCAGAAAHTGDCSCCPRPTWKNSRGGSDDALVLAAYRPVPGLQPSGVYLHTQGYQQAQGQQQQGQGQGQQPQYVQATYDPQTGQYHVPTAMQQELLSGQQTVPVSQMQEPYQYQQHYPQQYPPQQQPQADAGAAIIPQAASATQAFVSADGDSSLGLLQWRQQHE